MWVNMLGWRWPGAKCAAGHQQPPRSLCCGLTPRLAPGLPLPYHVTFILLHIVWLHSPSYQIDRSLLYHFLWVWGDAEHTASIVLQIVHGNLHQTAIFMPKSANIAMKNGSMGCVLFHLSYIIVFEAVDFLATTTDIQKHDAFHFFKYLY